MGNHDVPALDPSSLTVANGVADGLVDVSTEGRTSYLRINQLLSRLPIDSSPFLTTGHRACLSQCNLKTERSCRVSPATWLLLLLLLLLRAVTSVPGLIELASVLSAFSYLDTFVRYLGTRLPPVSRR